MAVEKSSRTASSEKKLRAMRRAQIVSSLALKESRDAFVRQQIETSMPFQIRTMRESQDMKQNEFAELLNKPQSVVSRLEDPRYGRYTINTLLEVASAFDVALLVTFAPFSALVNRAIGTSLYPGAVPSYSKDVMLNAQSDLEGSNVSMITAGKLDKTPEETSGEFHKPLTEGAGSYREVRYGQA